jgi:predicted RNA methylase
MSTKIACGRCNREIAPGRLVVHQKSAKCVPVGATVAGGAQAAAGATVAGAEPAGAEPAGAEPAGAAVAVALPADVRGYIWACRDDLRLVGVTGMEALECIVAVIALRRFGELFPEMANPPEFFGDLSCRFDLFGGGVEAITNNRATFTQLLSHPNDDGTKNNDGTPVGKAKMIRDAFVALKALPAAAAHGQFFAGDKASMLATFPCEDDAAAGKLLHRIADGVAYDPSADTVGRAIQSVTKDFAAEAKDLGQFFTPPPIIDVAMTRALAAYRDGAVTVTGAASAAGAVAARPLGRVLDPTCGSGTFLLRADAAGAAAIAGVELSKIIHRLALTNLVVGCRMPPPPAAVVCGDVLTKPLPGEDAAAPGSARFDTVLANPPYGIRGVERDSLVAALGAAGPRVYPLKTTATGFFLQRIVAALTIGGRGVVVLPNGKELSKADPASVIFRKALCHALDILEIIAVPAGMFENTATTTTVILVFEKRHELADVVLRVGGRGTTTIAPDRAPATTRVALSRLTVGADGAASTAPVDGAPAFVGVAELAAAGWELAPGAYSAAPPIASAYPMVPLGEIVTLVKGSVQASKVVPGQFPVITMASGKTHSAATDDGAVLAIAVVSPVGRFYFHVGKCAIADILCRLVPVSESAAARYDVRYLYHVLDKMTLDIRSHCEKGAANKTLDKKKFGQIIIPLPPIELQRAIAAALYAADAEAASLYKRAADTRADARAAADAALAFGLSAGTGGSDDDTGADDDAADAAAAADVDC